MKLSRPKLQLVILLALLPLLLFALKKAYDIRRGAAAIPANITIDTSVTQGKIPSQLWRNLSQGGEEAVDMINPVIKQVKELNPELIRVDHLFDYYNVVRSPGDYDFSQLDKVVESIVATGAKPMLSLSYTPSIIAKNNQNANEPQDWNEWFNLIKTTVKRYSVDKNIDGIYYEVWNEPDLFGSWRFGKDPNYATLYTQTSRAAQAGSPSHNFKIGGPAITAFYSNWVKSLFKTASAASLPLDFISWHKYSKNPDDYVKDVVDLSQILTDYPQYFSIEKLITEVGPDSEPNPWYDSNASGIHLIALATKLSGQVHRLFTFEVVDGPTIRSDKSSGWGLITHPNNGLKPKPRYFALKFLNQLKGQRLTSSGDGSFVSSISSKNDQTIQTLLVNYDPNLSHSETVPVSFQNIENGDYIVKTSTYMGKTTSKKINVTGGIYNDSFYLDPNTAILVEIISE